MTNAMVVLSGGQDSATCLACALHTYDNVRAVTFDYGQRHRIELVQAVAIIERASQLSGRRIPQDLVKVPDVLIGTSPLTNREQVVELYESADTLPSGLEKTFVPGRNILFLAIAASRGYVHFDGDPFLLVTGVSQEDFGGYPDCRSTFMEAMQTSLNRGLYLDDSLQNVVIETPLIYLSKADTVRLARDTEFGMELVGLSHTCYNGLRGTVHDDGSVTVGCGHCHACLLRSRGFADAGIEDPAKSLLATDLLQAG